MSKGLVTSDDIDRLKWQPPFTKGKWAPPAPLKMLKEKSSFLVLQAILLKSLLFFFDRRNFIHSRRSSRSSQQKIQYHTDKVEQKRLSRLHCWFLEICDQGIRKMDWKEKDKREQTTVPLKTTKLHFGIRTDLLRENKIILSCVTYTATNIFLGQGTLER